MKKSTPKLQKLNFLADESFGIKAYRYLSLKGFNVTSVTEISPGVSDKQVIKLANKQRRIIITLDKDFGNLVFKQKLYVAGVIFLRLHKETVENKTKAIEYLVTYFFDKLQGRFVTYKDGKTRLRKIKSVD